MAIDQVFVIYFRYQSFFMGRLFACAFLFLLFAEDSRGQIFLHHINIVDVENGRIIPDKNVRIEKDRITAIGSTIAAGSSDSVYDCSGKYLIPGLWDMHIHDGGDAFTRSAYIPLFLANGVTGVRDMWGSPGMLQLKKDIEQGRFIGPHMIVGSPIIEGPVSLFPPTLKAATPERGKFLVDSLAAAGYDFIKVYSTLRKDVYLSIAKECKEKKIPLEGHMPIELGLVECVNSGQRSFEHNFGINIFLSGKEPEKIAWAKQFLDTAHSMGEGTFMAVGEPLVLSRKDLKISHSLLQQMINRRVAIVPTLTLMQGRGLDSKTMLARTKGLEYLPKDFVDYWSATPPLFSEKLITTYGTGIKFLEDNGVIILAGTDVNNPFCVPGFGLQQELVNLNEAGLTNAQVLRAATFDAARFLYLEKDLGTVSNGKIADLLILGDDPLKDIHNTQNIYALILGGKYFSKQQLEDMLAPQQKK